MAASWDSVNLTDANGYYGRRFTIGAPRMERRIDGFSGTDGVIITDFGQREQTVTMTSFAKESERGTMQGKIGNSSNLVTDAQGTISDAVLTGAEWFDYFLIGGTQYARCRLTWIA